MSRSPAHGFSTTAACPLSRAPAKVDAAQLEELGLQLRAGIEADSEHEEMEA